MNVRTPKHGKGQFGFTIPHLDFGELRTDKKTNRI